VRALTEADAPIFRRELREFLEVHAPVEAVGARGRSVDGIPDWARRWQAALFDNGWLIPDNPPGLGGRNASSVELLVYLEEMVSHGLVRSVHYPGYGIVAPTLREFGNPSQKGLIIPAFRGDETWCVGMSEPDAGSDLSALRTRATRDGESFVVEGGKIWTSYAMLADWCLCYVRTDTADSAKNGVSVLIVNMQAPGVTVHPLRQVTGQAEFAEVVFDGVVVHEDQLVGGLGQGWQIALAALGYERRGLWVEWLAGIAYGVQELMLFARSSGAIRDPEIAMDLAGAYERVLSTYALGLKSLPQTSTHDLGSHSLLKLAVSELAVELSDLGIRIGHAQDRVDGGLPGPFALQQLFRALGDTIGGGTAEMQRNAIAVRMLGLPGPRR
jgi:alkylation response protein AidB-like acyl-CoA dehydrogenase